MPTAEAGFRPGSTVVAILAHDGGAEIAHVGDSRIYLIHGGAISQVTRDHSMVQEMVDRNIIRAEDAAKHPDANKIPRARHREGGRGRLRANPLSFVERRRSSSVPTALLTSSNRREIRTPRAPTRQSRRPTS